MQPQRPPELPLLRSQAQRQRTTQPELESIVEQRLQQKETRSFFSGVLPSFIVLSSLAAISVLGWYAFQEAKGPIEPSELPVIKADASPYKIKPLDPGGEEIANLDKRVYDTISAIGREEDAESLKTIKSSEEPLSRDKIKAISTLNGSLEDSAPEDSLISSIAPASGETASDSLPEAQLVNEDGNQNNDQQNTAPETTAVKETTEDTMPDDAEKKIEAAVEEVEKIEMPKIKPVISDNPDNPLVETKKADKNETKDIKNKTDKTKKSAEKKTVNKTTPAPASLADKSSTKAINGIKIQLGAYRSTSEVKNTWKKLKDANPSLLGKYSYSINKVDLGAKGIFYRLQVGAFKDKSEASSICKKLSAKGQGCFVVK